MKTLLTLTVFLIFSMTNLHAQTTDSSTVPLQHVIYLEYAGFLVLGSVSLNYEHALTNSFSFRVGVGVGYTSSLMDSQRGTGLTAMFNYITPLSNNRLEAGLGASLVYSRDLGGGGGIIPAISIGYRYQPVSGGFVYRVGLTCVYWFGTPLQVSIGYAF